MSPEQSPARSEVPPRARRWLVVAGCLQIVALLLVMSALVRLTPLTLTFSLGVGGPLLALACGLYVAIVARDLRMRRIL